MAPIPSNNTGVLFVDYNTCGEDHTIQMRYGSGGSVTDAMTVMENFLNALDPGLNLVTIIGARERAAGGNVTFPVAWTGAATYGGSAGTREKTAQYIDFVGRSVGGVRLRVAMFGVGDVVDTTEHDYRFSRAASAVVDDALTALEASAVAPVAADGDAVSWHQYANVGVNAYWRNRIR